MNTLSLGKLSLAKWPKLPYSNGTHKIDGGLCLHPSSSTSKEGVFIEGRTGGVSDLARFTNRKNSKSRIPEIKISFSSLSRVTQNFQVTDYEG